jgi:regulator of RNase E activity RraB
MSDDGEEEDNIDDDGWLTCNDDDDEDDDDEDEDEDEDDGLRLR